MKATALLLRCLLAIVLTSLSPTLLHAQGYQWSNFAGMPGGVGNVDGTGTAARFNYPRNILIDTTATNAYVSDTFSHTIRKIVLSTGVVTTFVGGVNQRGSADGTKTAARFSNPRGLGINKEGTTLYVADSGNSTIRKIVISTGVVTTLAGLAGEFDYADGAGSAARFDEPVGLAVGADGMLYVTDYENQCIRKVTPAGVVTTLAGSTTGEAGSADGTGTAARFDSVEGITVDGTGTVYVADSGNCTIRQITKTGVVTTLAGMVGVYAAADGTGTDARFDYPTGIVLRNGDLYVADSYNASLRKVTQAGVVTTFVGMLGAWGSADGTGSAARFQSCTAVALDKNGVFYITDDENQNIRKVTAAGVVTTMAGMLNNKGIADGTGTVARFDAPHSITIGLNNEVYVGDTYNYTVRKITVNGEVTTYAGKPDVYGSVNGAAEDAILGYSFGLVSDATGNIFVTDTYKYNIRKIAAGTREVSDFVGTSGSYGNADGVGPDARFQNPYGMTRTSDGTIYVADVSDNTIRKITSAGEVTTFAGTHGGLGLLNGTGTAAKFYQPYDVAADGDDNIYVADYYNNAIRKITPAGVVTTLAGGVASGSADGTGGAARFNLPSGVAIDPYGNVIVCDSGNNTIRRVTPAGVVTTIGGMAPIAAAADGLGTTSRFSQPIRVAIDSNGIIYVADRRNNRIVKGVPSPEIAVEEPAATDLKDGATTLDFGKVDIATTKVKTFTLRSTGTAALSGMSISVTGDHAADFVATSIGATLNPDQTATFTVTFNADTSGPRNAVLHITSNDADEGSFDIILKATTLDTPIINSIDSPHIAYEGTNNGFDVQATHPTLTPTYQWFKNGAKIAGATSNSIGFIKLNLTDGATYTVAVTCNKVTVQRSTSLTVVRYAEEILPAPINGKVTPTVMYGGPATFEWKHDSVLIPGATINKLALTALNAATSSGDYNCKVIAPDGDIIPGGTFTVRVFDDKPVVTKVQNFPDGAVGRPYSRQIAIDTAVHLSPVSYSATGLPDGVKLNTKTGLVSGVPTKAKDYKIKVTATNTFGSSTSLEDTVTIAPLPDNAMGTFTGRVAARNAINEGLGGRVDFTIASTGVISGSLTMGTKTYPFKGLLVIGGAKPITDINVARTGLPALEMHLELDLTNQLIDAATSSVRYVADSAAISGWRQKWKSTGTPPLTPATATPKLFTFGLRTTGPIAGQPYGDGYGTFTLATDGKVTVAGKTGDGDSYTCAAFAGPQGQILLFSTLSTTAPKGSILGILDIDPTDTGVLTDTLTGDAAWVRPVNAKSRVYPDGYGPLPITAFGTRYVPAVAPALILGMTTIDKAKLTFANGGLATASINPNIPSLDILAGNKPSPAPALSLGNPGSVKFLTLNAATGLFTGTFILTDPETRAAFASKSLSRTANFSGILTQDTGSPVGIGHFLLPEMPHDASPPTIPATTPTTSNMLSGSILLQKK